MDSDKSLGLMTFQEMFSGPAEKEQQTFKKIKQLKGSKETSGKNELLRVLRNQRVHIDQNAIHFVASPRAGPRADARNSVFKLSQRYQQLPDRENVSRIRQMFQKVKEEEDSGDDEWAPKYGKVPDVLKGQAAAKMLDEPSPEHLMAEVQNIGDEAQTAPQGVLTQEEIDDQQVVDDFVDTANARRRASVDRKEAADAAAASAPAEEEDDSDDEDEDDGAVHFDDTDLSVLNSMQKEFISMNLFAWFTDVRKAYETGVKLVKVNALGYKFIRIVQVKHFILTIKQPHTLSKVKIDRQVAVTSIEGVHLGKESRQFRAMLDLIKENKLPPEEDPPATQCAVVHLPDNRTLSLIFLDEDNRNGFVFFLRVMIKKALSAAKQLGSK